MRQADAGEVDEQVGLEQRTGDNEMTRWGQIVCLQLFLALPSWGARGLTDLCQVWSSLGVQPLGLGYVPPAVGFQVVVFRT